MTTAGANAEIINNGTILVSGEGASANHSKAMSVNGGTAINKGTIKVSDAYGMVSNTNQPSNRTLLRNKGTIEFFGESGAAMVDNGGNTQEDGQINLTNKGQINVHEGTGILVNSSSLKGRTIIHQSGSIQAAEGAYAIDVQAIGHEVDIRLEEGSSTAGLVRIGVGDLQNQTNLTVDNAGVQNIALDAMYINDVELIGSTLTITDEKNLLTINNLRLDNSKFAVAETEDDLTLTINGIVKEGTSFVDLSNASVILNQDWTTLAGTTESFKDLTIGTAEEERTYINEGTVNVENAFNLVNKTFVNRGNARLDVGIDDVERGSFTTGAGTVFTNDQTSTVDIYADATVGGKIENAGMFWVRGDVTVNDEFHNLADSSTEDTLKPTFNVEGDLTLGKYGFVINEGDMTLTGNLATAEKEGGNSMLQNLGTLTLGNSTLDGYVRNESGAIVASNAEVVVSNRFENLNGATGEFNGGLNVEGSYLNGGDTHGSMLTVAGSFENQVGAGSFSQFNTVVVYGSATNHGQFIVDETLSGTGTLDNQNYLIASAVSASNGFKFINGENATAAISGNAEFDALNNQGQLTVGGDMVLFGTGEAINVESGTIDVAGTLSVVNKTFTNAGTIDAGSLVTTDGGIIRNEGSMTIGSTLDGVNYIESGANAEISFKDDLITNSQITLTNGAVWTHSLGMGNTYYAESDQLLNVVNGDHLDSNWADGFSQIIADTVSGDNTFVINAGGALKFNHLGAGKIVEPGEDSHYITVNGGVLQTSLDQIFDGVAFDDGKGIRIEDAEQVGSIGANTVGDLSEIADAAIAFGEKGGYIVFDDEHYWDSITSSIDDVFAEHTDTRWDKVTIAFTGENEAEGPFDIQWANEKLNGIESGINFVFSDITLSATGESEFDGPFYLDGGKLVMDGTEGDGSSQIGFSRISDTDAVDIVDGGHLTLVGAEDSVSLIGKNGGTATVNNGILTLGGGKGWVAQADISNGGVLEVIGGKYAVDDVNVYELGRLAIEAGTLNVKNLYSAGEITNAGVLGAESIKLAGGQLTNDGIVHSDKLTVGVKGSLVNNGQTTWGSVEIQGSAVNNGLEYVEGDYNLSSGGSQVNYGTQHVLGSAVVGGIYSNAVNPEDDSKAGYLAVDKVLRVDQGGTFNNAGWVEVKESIVVNGSVDNSGYILTTGLAGSTGGVFTNRAEGVVEVLESADLDSLENNGSVDIGGALTVVDLTNTASAKLWADSLDLNNDSINAGYIELGNEAKLHGTFDNRGTMIVGGALTADDIFFNHAEAGLSVRGDASFATVFVNQGTAVFDGAVSINQAVNAGDDATMAVDGTLSVAGSFDNQATLTVYGDLSVDGSFRTSGSTFVDGAAVLNDTFTQMDGTFVALGGETGNVINANVSVSGGKALFANSTFNGTLDVMNEDTRVDLELADNTVNGDISVDGATLQIGDQFDTAATQSGSVLIAGQRPIVVTETGSIAVGTGAAEAEVTDGSVWFGDDSVLQINTSLMESEGLFQGQANGSFTVAGDSKIDIQQEVMGWGTYKLTDGFGETTAGSWTETTNVSYVDGTDIPIWVDKDKDGDLVLVVGDNDIQSKLPDVAIPNIVNEVISNPDLRNPNQEGVLGFISGAVENGILNQNLQAEVINDTAQIMAAGGVMVQGMTLVGNVLDITDRHLSYEDVHFKNGQLQRFDGVRLWADALGQRVDASGYDFSGSSAEFDGYNTGFILGADLMASCDARYGAAFAYQNANIDSNGSAVKTSNEADAYTFALYAAKTFGNFNFIGSLAYTRIDSDLEQSLPGALGAKQGKHTMDVQNDIYTLGLKGEYNIALSKSVQAVPYVGVRAVWMDTSDEKSKMAHQDAFDYDTDSVTQVQFPIGVAFQGTTETKSGWTGRGVIDFSVTPVAGDKDVDTTITANGLTAEDVVNTEFADDLTGAVRIGISAEKDNMAFGGNLGFSTGGSRDGNVTFGLNARYRF